MFRRSAAARLVTVATLASLLATIGGTVAVQAQEARLTGPGVQAATAGTGFSGNRTERRVNVGTLAPANDKRPAYPSPHLPRSHGRSAAAPDVQGAVLPPPVPATSNGDPQIDQATAFAGLARVNGTATQGEPPDPWVATGPEHVFQAVNRSFRISSRSGQALQTIDMFEFFGLDDFYKTSDDVEFFDPRVIYDSLHGRWIAIEASFDCFQDLPEIQAGSGYLDIAVSDGPDPRGDWRIRSIAYTDEFPDYPGIGTSTDKIVLSANLFALNTTGPTSCIPGGYLGAEMAIVAWSQMIVAGSPRLKQYDMGTNSFAWRPALQAPATSPTVFAVAEGDETNEQVLYARIDGNAATGVGLPDAVEAIDLTADGIISPFVPPPSPQQPGASHNTIDDAVDARPTDAVWKGNRLAFVSTYPCITTGATDPLARDCVRVSELATTSPATPTLIQDFLVAKPDQDLYMGGVGYALNDDLHVVWTQSRKQDPTPGVDPGEYPSSYGAYQDAAAANNSLSDRSLLSAGTGNYPGDRWGDYVGVAQDPQVPNAVWQANQYSAGVTGWKTEVTQLQTGGSTFHPITPLRVLDTRPGITIGLSGSFAHGVARSWQVAGFSGGAVIPANAIAVTGNLTVTNQTAAGYVSVTPGPNNNPSSSTINFPLGDNRANNLTIPIAPGGKVSAVYRASAGKTAHLIFDVTGYFVAGSAENEYKTITPVRALDTRPGIGIGLSGAFQKNVPRKVSIGPERVPATAVAITGNLTVVGQTGAGFLSITPTSNANPATSNLNFPLGDTRANGFVATLDDNDDLWIVYKTTAAGFRSANVILDVTGYFLDDPSGMQYFPLTPGRLMDTRFVPLSVLAGAFTSGSPRKLVVGGHWGVPVSAGAMTGNLTAVGQTAAGFVSVTLTSNPNPTTSNLNFPLGDTRANGITVPLAATHDAWLVYKAASGKKTHLILDVSGYFN